MADEQKWVVLAEEAGQRQDVFLAGQQEGLSRSRAVKLLEDGAIRSSHGQLKAGYKVRPGDCYIYTPVAPTALSVEAEAIPLQIVFEDASLVVVDKPAGLVVHPGAGNQRGTLVNALLASVDNLSGINGVARPGIVHRIDKDTSGLLVVAKTDVAHLSLSQQIATKTAGRRYLTLVHDNLRQDQGVVDAPIGRCKHDRKRMAVREDGRPAVTHWQVRQRFGRYTYLEVRLETGRTHQIRVHLSSIGHPVVGDKKYGAPPNEFRLERQFLHAYALTFVHPVTTKAMSFTSPLPDDLQIVLDKLSERGGHPCRG